jgi:hypothetical protein
MKYLLARMALQNPKRFFETFGPDGDTAYLTALWESAGEKLPSEERASAYGMSTQIRTTRAQRLVLVLVMPAPATHNEAYFLGVIQLPDDGVRVFCLERSADPVSGEVASVLIEIASNGRANWGRKCTPAVDDFVDALGRLTTDPSAQPLTFTHLPLA